MSYEYPDVEDWTEEKLGVGPKSEGIYPLRIESQEKKRAKKNPDSEYLEMEISFQDDPAAPTMTHRMPLPSMAKDADLDAKELKSNNFKKLQYGLFVRSFGLNGTKPKFESWVGKEASVNVIITSNEWPIGSGKFFKKNELGLGSF